MMSRLRRRMRRYNHNPCDCNQISETETVPSTIDPSKRPWKSRAHNGGVHHLHPSPTAKNYLLQSGSHQLSREQYERHERPNKNSESNQDKRYLKKTESSPVFQNAHVFNIWLDLGDDSSPKKIFQKKKQHEIEILTASAANDVASHQGDWISGGDSGSWRLVEIISRFPRWWGDAFIFGILC